VPRYLSMLEKYVAGQRGAVDEIRAALAQGDRATATRLAHTTKGVSGNIGATAVQQRAEVVEHSVMNPASPSAELEPLVDALQALLQPLVEALSAHLPQAPSSDPAAPAVTIDEAELARVTTHLRGLVEEMDAEASEWLQAHASLLSAAYPAHAKALRAALEDFNFDLALQQLDTAAAARLAARPAV